MGLMAKYSNVAKNNPKVMADYNTKAIAARVPMTEYIRIITDATELRLSVSEYIIMKLNAPATTADLHAELLAAQREIAELRGKSDKAEKLNLRGVDSECQAELANFRKLATKMYENIVDLKDEAGVSDVFLNRCIYYAEQFFLKVSL